MRTLGDALAYAEAEHRSPSRDWSGWCLKFVRTAWDIPAVYPDAITAFHAVATSTKNTQPVIGSAVYWDVSRYGHIALSAGGPYVWSTDILRPGKVDKVHIDLITQRWGAKYLGWSAELNNVHLPIDDPTPYTPRLDTHPQPYRRTPMLFVAKNDKNQDDVFVVKADGKTLHRLPGGPASNVDLGYHDFLDAGYRPVRGTRKSIENLGYKFPADATTK